MKHTPELSGVPKLSPANKFDGPVASNDERFMKGRVHDLKKLSPHELTELLKAHRFMFNNNVRDTDFDAWCIGEIERELDSRENKSEIE